MATVSRARRPRQSPEKRIEWSIISALRLLGFHVSKLSQPQRPRGMTIGIPDLFAVHAGWRLALFIEVKAPGGRLTTGQRVWHREVGEVVPVVVAYGIDDVLEELRCLGAPIQ